MHTSLPAAKQRQERSKTLIRADVTHSAAVHAATQRATRSTGRGDYAATLNKHMLYHTSVQWLESSRVQCVRTAYQFAKIPRTTTSPQPSDVFFTASSLMYLGATRYSCVVTTASGANYSVSSLLLRRSYLPSCSSMLLMLQLQYVHVLQVHYCFDSIVGCRVWHGLTDMLSSCHVYNMMLPQLRLVVHTGQSSRIVLLRDATSSSLKKIKLLKLTSPYGDRCHWHT